MRWLLFIPSLMLFAANLPVLMQANLLHRQMEVRQTHKESGCCERTKMPEQDHCAKHSQRGAGQEDGNCPGNPEAHCLACMACCPYAAQTGEAWSSIGNPFILPATHAGYIQAFYSRPFIELPGQPPECIS